MPAPVARICQSTGSHHVTPRTNSAPRSAPGTEPEAADDDHGEHHEALARAVGVELEPVLLVHEERARERGEEARHRERLQCRGARVHAERARGAVVLPDRDERTSGAAPTDADDGDDHERQRDEAEEVVARLRVDVDDAEQIAVVRRAAGGNQSKRVPSPKMRGLSSHAVVARPNASVMTARVSPRPPQHGQADERGETARRRLPRRGGRAPRSQPRRAVSERADRGADRHERHLSEADLAGPPGEDDERQGDDPVDHRHRREVGAALGEHDRHERKRDERPPTGATHA